MFRFYRHMITTSKNYSNYSFLSNFISTKKESIQDIVEHNIKYLDNIEINIYNPKTVFKGSCFRESIYTAKLYFYNKENDIRFTKSINGDTFDELTNKIKEMLEKEIKL